MGITNAISSVIIVGAILAAGGALNGVSGMMGFIAVVLASINIFGGFIITRRMLSMFKKKQ
jgi:NAD(P) transhydrogenase subunit alpha